MELERIRIEVTQCAKTYAGGSRGLHPTDLTVEPGEVLALLGPSGCGKTTLLCLIAGLESADPGSRILFGNSDVTRLPVEQRGIGMVFQHYALFPQMTVEANIGYGLKIRGVAESERRRAVGELAELLRRLHITAIHVTHDQQEALAIADRLAVMQAGRIVQVGDGETLYRNPTHPFVASFLGRVNRLHRDLAARSRHVLSFGGQAYPCLTEWSQHADMLVRPEDIEVGPLQSGWGRAMVTRRSFLGERVRLTLALDDQAELFADADRDHPALAGERVGVRIRPGRLMPCLETNPA